jgi:chemotaxis protein methyltransferase CheR
MDFGEIDINDQEYQAIRAFLKRRTGIDLAESKRALVFSRLLKRIRAVGAPSFSAYLELAESDADEGSRFVSALTTNVTEFFRELHHFEALSQLTGELSKGREQLSVWSAGCSTGEEPWSLAVTLAEANPPVKWRLLATDIDEEVLSTARSAVYPMERVQRIPHAQLARHFWRDPQHRKVKVKDELMANVSFGQLNLQDEWPMRSTFDVIFCRNVLIYFDGATRARVVSRLANQLRLGGYLMLGHSEALLGTMPLLSPRGKTTFQRVSNADAS